MPFIQVTMLQGRTAEQKHDLIKKVSQATSDALGVPIERVRMAIVEVTPDEWGIGGEPVAKVRPNG